MNAPASLKLPLPMDAIRAFCQRWNVSEFALFGSVLHDDFNADSDVDVMITFADRSGMTLFRLMTMTEELEALFGRKVDLITRQNIETSRNYVVRKQVLNNAQVIFAT